MSICQEHEKYQDLVNLYFFSMLIKSCLFKLNGPSPKTAKGP